MSSQLSTLFSDGNPELMSETIDLKSIQRFHLNDVAQGLIETSPNVCGNWRKSYVMHLKRMPGKSRLPRGFRSRVSKPKIEFV